MEEQILINNEKLELTCKKGVEDEKPSFEKGLVQYSHIPNLNLELTYCDGLADAKSGRKHNLYINHLKRVLVIMRPFKQTILIPFASIKGAEIKREDGIPQNKLSYEQQYDEYRKKQLFYITVYYSWKGSDASITYSNRQTRLVPKDNVFVMEYILNHLPELADYFAAGHAEMDEYIHSLENNIEENDKATFENYDTLPETSYSFQYCGNDGFDTPGEAKLVLDHTTLTIHFSQPVPDMAIPLPNVLDSVVREDCPMEYPDPDNDSLFYIDIYFVLDGKETTLQFLHKQKHIQINDPVKRLDYLLQKRIKEFHSAFPNNTYQSVTEVAKAGESAAEQIRQFKALLDDGIITQEEFDAKKKQLLNL